MNTSRKRESFCFENWCSHYFEKAKPFLHLETITWVLFLLLLRTRTQCFPAGLIKYSLVVQFLFFSSSLFTYRRDYLHHFLITFSSFLVFLSLLHPTLLEGVRARGLFCAKRKMLTSTGLLISILFFAF